MNRIIPLELENTPLNDQKPNSASESPVLENDASETLGKKTALHSILKKKFRPVIMSKALPSEETNQSSTLKLREDYTPVMNNAMDAENFTKRCNSGLKRPIAGDTHENQDANYAGNSSNDQKKGGLFSLIKKNLPDLNKNPQLKNNLIK